MIITGDDTKDARSGQDVHSTLGAPAIELINSNRRGADLLDDPRWVAERLARWGRRTGRTKPSEVRALGDVRQFLGRMAESIAKHGDVRAADVRRLNAILARTPTMVQLERVGDGFVLDMSAVGGSRGELAVREVAGSFAAMLRRDWPPRLNLCANPDCRLAFYDESKNRKRRWCDGGACGNRIRVRRHRAAQT